LWVFNSTILFRIYPAKPTFIHSYCFFTIIFRWILLEAAQIWQELAPHYFPTDCFGASSHSEGTGSILFSGGLFWR
jgi:hypothetical protein